MTTNDLIARLAIEPPGPPLRPGRLALLALVAAVVPVTLFLAILGPRRGLAAAWMNPVVPFKTLIPLFICGLALTLALRLTRPEARPGWLALGFLPPAVAALALWIGAFVTRPPALRFAEVGVVSLAECLGLILLLSIVPAVAALRLLRQGASASPTLSAALAGLAAATGATTGYSLFCTRDNPLFFVTWYGVAITLVTLITAAAGRRLLRW